MDQLHHFYNLRAASPFMLEQSKHQQIPEPSVWERHSTLQNVCMVLSIFFWFFSFTAAFGAITISRWRYSGKHQRSLSSRLPKDDAPGVSIIRPLRGIDCNMYENLASSFRQDYPRFEIIFSVAHPNDPAIAVVKDLMKKFPNVDTRLIIGEKNVGINPKINNMIQSYETAKYDIVWVCDSNVYVDPGCMGRSVDKMMKPGVGLVHHLPFGVRPQTLGSELELMFLNTVHAKMYLFINWTGLASCVVGKSSLYRRSDLDKVGGLAKFGKYMAEDNLIATEIFNMGYKHEMTSDLAYQSLGSMTPSDYFLRRARWTRIRKYTVTGATIVEPFIEMIGCGLAASYGFNLLYQTHFLNFLAFHIVMWFLIDLSMYQALHGEKVHNLRGFLMAWSMRELAALPLYLYAVVGSTVDWRDQTFMLKRDGTVEPLALPASSSAPSGGAIAISSPTSTTFANLANTVVPQSTQDSLRKFFRRPAVISVVSSTLAVIHFVVDILIKSQRNGNYEDEDDDEVSLSEDAMLAEDTLFIREEEEEGEDEKELEQELRSKDTSKLKLRNPPLKRPHLRHRATYNCSSSSDDGGIEYEIVSATKDEAQPRRSARIRMQMESKAMGSQQGPKPPVFSRTRSEVDVLMDRQLTEDDALSKAVEPYLSDSLSRRGRTRRDLSASAKFKNT
ncbi:hypothetical protein BGZ80_011156 [Entomortierella chlamydospora]|uniref:Ceramide glucosyltransferase n=1 Tax=Entomortierella chlamydospora TaxID=101097 RepID=A0A9P6MU07_9FUNG|nr:hypothetical protein BGZ79_011119 [Entomortierella chlamydospora]KAG0013323.1 hypothetical protein BGZ80_011156 [Entomortierella chlamydospora]